MSVSVKAPSSSPPAPYFQKMVQARRNHEALLRREACRAQFAATMAELQRQSRFRARLRFAILGFGLVAIPAAAVGALLLRYS